MKHEIVQNIINIMSAKIQPQYRIFYSWQLDNPSAKKMLGDALNVVVKDFKKKGIVIERVEGGGGLGFISIEDAVRMKIQSCDIFVGDITPVGNVALKEKLLPNANVLFEMGIATECLSAEQIVIVAAEGDWKFENMPFDFNHNSYLTFDPTKPESVQSLANKIGSRIKTANEKSVRINQLYFADWLVNKNIASGKYLPDTYLEDRELKDKVRCFVLPSKMYQVVYERLARMNFSMYDKRRARRGQYKLFSLRMSDYDLTNKAFDLPLLRRKVNRLKDNLTERIDYLENDGNNGWRIASKVRHQAKRVELMNSRFLVVKSSAGGGKTNFLCDIVRNVLKPNHVPYVFVNAYELSADRIAQSIALEHNYIGNGSLEDVLLHIERFCQQHRQYMLIVIDGLNEHPQQKLFIRNLTRVLQAVIGYEHVKVLMSCRSTFFKNNYRSLQDVFDSDLAELELGHSHGRHELDHSEQECIIERYKKHFDVKGNLSPNVQQTLVSNLLLMRLFFEIHRGEDISQYRHIGREETYSKYYDLMKGELHNILEQPTELVENIVHTIIRWMLENDIVKNVPTKELFALLSEEEKKCFNTFINANLLLQIDSPENDGGTDEVINFSFEDIRDFLIARYLISNVFEDNRDKFNEYIQKYTNEANNLAEGIKRYIFLIARNSAKQSVIDSIKELDWYNDIKIHNIWGVKNEYITDDDVDFVKSKIQEYPQLIGRMLAISRWNPSIYSKLNIKDLMAILNSLSAPERIDLIESIWSRKYNERLAKYSDRYKSDNYQFVKMVKDFVIDGYRGGRDDLEPLVALLTYFVDEKGELYSYVRSAIQEFKEAKDAGAVAEERHLEPLVPSFYQYDTFSYLMPVRNVTREDFLTSAGVKGNYAAVMFGGLYDAIFTEAEDVEDLYNKYYSNEYLDLRQFITMHYCVPMPTTEALVSVLQTEGNRIIDFSSIDYGDDSVDQFVISDEMFDRFYALIKYKENEDKN